MSDPHGHHAATTVTPFTPAELRAFQVDDKRAGGAVIVLMTVIFFIGLVLYGYVATHVALWPQV